MTFHTCDARTLMAVHLTVIELTIAGIAALYITVPIEWFQRHGIQE